MSDVENTQASAETQNTEQPERMIPYDRFKQVIDQKNELQSQISELLDWKKAQETKAQEVEEAERLRRGEHEQVIADLKPRAERAKQLESVLSSYLEVELESVPKQFRELIPDGDVTAKLQWIAKARQSGLFSAPKPPAPNLNATEGAGSSGLSYTNDDVEMARLLKLPVETYMKQKQEIQNRNNPR